jgi:hypothetical protein
VSDQPRKIMVEIDELQQLMNIASEEADTVEQSTIVNRLFDKYQPDIDRARKAK